MALNVKYARNLPKNQLGGVIFACSDGTIKECLRSQIFGLPSQHFSYVQKIEPGLPLFLFNTSERKLLGIYEATSKGKMNINPYAWTGGGLERTRFPSQVLIRVRLECKPLGEVQFKPIIIENYYEKSKFLFELDRAQANKLISKFSSLPVARRFSQNPQRWFPIEPKLNRVCETQSMVNEYGNSCDCIETSTTPDDLNSLVVEALMQNHKVEECEKEEFIYMKLQELDLSHECSDAKIVGCAVEAESPDDIDLVCDNGDDHIMVTLEENNNESSLASRDYPIKIAQVESETKKEIYQLPPNRFAISETESSDPCTSFDDEEYLVKSPERFQLDPIQPIYIVGGYDGVSWLSDLDSFSPSLDSLTPLKPMSVARSYTSVAIFDGELYAFGGGAGSLWHDSVESYNVARNEWTPRARLKQKRGSLAAASANGMLFAIGGGNGTQCFSNMEMFDPELGRWIFALSMREKRFALAGEELNGAIYAVGGYDGDDYLRSAERFDPRDHSWNRIAMMNSRRGCHSLVAMNEKLYAIGGFDGTSMVRSIEIYEPRVNTWTVGEPMHQARGYFAAAVLKESIYAIGGVKTERGDISETIEVYKEGEGWQVTSMRAVGIRAFASAVVLPS